MTTGNLTDLQHEILLETLARFADRIDRVDLYGSRARGDHLPGSDVDLILAGDIDLETLLSIAVALEESWLSINADVQRYSDRLEPGFAANVAKDAVPLFTREDLLGARASRAA